MRAGQSVVRDLQKVCQKLSSTTDRGSPVFGLGRAQIGLEIKLVIPHGRRPASRPKQLRDCHAARLGLLKLAVFRLALSVPAPKIERHRDACGAQFIRKTAVDHGPGHHMPPMDKAAMLCAAVRRRRPFWTRLRSRTLTMALNTVSKARFALTPLRATRSAMPPLGRSSPRPRNAGETDSR